jgi:hypothetical protein
VRRLTLVRAHYQNNEATVQIGDATKHYERWLSHQTTIVAADLRRKHEAMSEDPFSFLRATYYRWAQRFTELDKRVANAPKLLAVGDLHLENFGTWRDGLGRLAWGINDFDEAFALPYTNDLVRLATSALVAIDARHLVLKAKDACGAIMDGYREGMESGGQPFVIGENHRWFKPILASPLRDPGLFWDGLRALPRERGALPQEAMTAILEMFPDAHLAYELRHRQAGLGSLGKPRFTAIAQWMGGPIAREAKALTLSAAAWAQSETSGPFYGQILANSVRSPDPYLKAQGPWVVRRLSPDSRRLEVESLGRVKDEEWLLHAMGFETANVHHGSSAARRSIAKHLKSLSRTEVRNAAIAMKKSLEKDFRRWRADR